MIALFTTLQRKDIILLEKISYFCGGIPKIFFQAVLWHIAIGGIHTHRVSGAEILAQRWFWPHCTHIIIWKCSAVNCNLNQFHTRCDIAQITIMMKWWLKSTEMSAIPGTGLPRAVCAPKSDSKVSQFLGTSHNIVINHICNQKPLEPPWFVIVCIVVRLSGWRPGSRRHLRIRLDFSQPMAFLRVSRGLHLGFW